MTCKTCCKNDVCAWLWKLVRPIHTTPKEERRRSRDYMMAKIPPCVATDDSPFKFDG